ncbi:hypothetical protein HPA12_11480, partial [Streptococcus suis]|nr:hypothetical protein [Streptococcus suis]
INGNTITVETKDDGSFDIVISDSNGTELSRSNIKNGLDGKDGIDGTDGIDGKDGINGNTITVETKEDGSFDIVTSDSNGTELSRS